MRIKIILFSIFALLGACAPTTVTPVNIPKAIVISESVQPSLEKTQKGIDESISENIKAQEKLKSQNQTLVSQKVAIVEALTQAERIKEKALAQQAITELEALNLITELTKVKTDHELVVKQNKDLEEGIYNQVLVLESTRNVARETMHKLIEKENEVKKLLDRVENLEGIVKTVTTENQKLQKDNNKLIKTSASSGVYKVWVIGGVVTIILLTSGYILIRAYVPSLKR